jgi:hypothetical protein
LRETSTELIGKLLSGRLVSILKRGEPPPRRATSSRAISTATSAMPSISRGHMRAGDMECSPNSRCRRSTARAIDSRGTSTSRRACARWMRTPSMPLHSRAT